MNKYLSRLLEHIAGYIALILGIVIISTMVIMALMIFVK
jgi:hypothetical protein